MQTIADGLTKIAQTFPVAACLDKVHYTQVYVVDL